MKGTNAMKGANTTKGTRTTTRQETVKALQRGKHYEGVNHYEGGKHYEGLNTKNSQCNWIYSECHSECHKTEMILDIRISLIKTYGGIQSLLKSYIRISLISLLQEERL